MVGSASAAVLMECGASDGYSYFIEGGIVPSDKAGWTSDGVASGRISLVQNGQDFDIMTTDATGGTYSYKADGAKIIPISVTPDEWAILAAFPLGVVEVHHFHRTPNGGEVIWIQSKFGSVPAKKASAFHASCKEGAK